jgi:diguanylate cyclase (GGDEF)-like protein
VPVEPPTTVSKQGDIRRRAEDRLLSPTLTVVDGPGLGQVHVLGDERRSWRVGRGEDVDLLLDTPSVSRQHAVLTLSRSGERPQLRIEDVGSTNGVLLNGRKVKDALLIAGDKIRLGDCTLRFEWMNQDELSYHLSITTKARHAERDPLTGLLQRRAMVQRLPSLLTDAESRGVPVSCILVDLDHFKSINDRYGHLCGDQVLQRVAAAISSVARREDLVVRYGGEEMLVVLPTLTAAGATEAAERLRATIAALAVKDVAPGLRVTASLGVAQWAAGESLDAWLRRTDAALYGAKGEGRNRVVLASPFDATDRPVTTRGLPAVKDPP